MKVLVIFLLAFVATGYPLAVDDVLEQWKQYKTKYGKNYSTSDEESKRFGIFKKHFDEINAHNDRYEKGETLFNQEINEFADWSDEEIHNFRYDGLVNQHSSGHVFKRTKSKEFVLPESIDWRDYGVVSEVKDQISTICASCWSFAETGSIEAQYALKTGNLVPLSKQNLIDCTLDKGNAGCGGGYRNVSFKYIEENGIESEADYPYEAKNGECRFNSSKSVTKISSYVEIAPKDELALQEAIATKGPVITSLDFCYAMFYKSGIYDDDSCSKTRVTHAVLLIGYGSENGNDFYIVKNSFGPNWGESGYFRILRNAGNKSCVVFGGGYPIL